MADHKHKWVYTSDSMFPVCEICRDSCFVDLETNIDELKAELYGLKYENNYLRNYIAHSHLDCVYCKLKKDNLKECKMPNCSRKEDMNVSLGKKYEDI